MLGAFWIGDEPRPGPALARRHGLRRRAVLHRRAAARRHSPASADPPATSAGSGSTSTRPRSPASCSCFVIIGAFLVEVAQGQDGSPYSALGAIGGLAYIPAIAFLRWRS